MNKALLLLALILPACNAALPPQHGAQLFRPGSKLLLIHRMELRTEGTGGTDSGRWIGYVLHPDGKVEEATTTVMEEKGQETEHAALEWLEQELTVSVARSSKAGGVSLALKPRRRRGGTSYADGDGTSGQMHYDTAKAPPKDKDSAQAQRDAQAMVKAIQYSVQLDGAWSPLQADASGGPFDAIEKEREDDNMASPEIRLARLQLHTGGVFSSIADAAAYLPGPEVRQGQTWRVSREKVFPHRPYGFYMLTNGCGFSTERSTCRIQSIEHTAAGRVATIEITGRRIPHRLEREGFEGGRSKRVRHMELTGTLRFNLDTKAVEELQLKSKPKFIHAEDKRMMNITFLHTVRLGPLTASDDD